MPRKRKDEVTDEELLKKIGEAGMSERNAVRDTAETDEEAMEDFRTRVGRILSITDNPHNDNNMLIFVMYDIESNKVRNLVSKYLVKKGCYRIQKSIFLADLPPETVSKIKTDLAQVQAAYDNNDSILIVPISTDYLQSMKIIGQNIDIDLIMRNRNTLFF